MKTILSKFLFHNTVSTHYLINLATGCTLWQMSPDSLPCPTHNVCVGWILKKNQVGTASYLQNVIFKHIHIKNTHKCVLIQHSPT